MPKQPIYPTHLPSVANDAHALAARPDPWNWTVERGDLYEALFTARELEAAYYDAALGFTTEAKQNGKRRNADALARNDEENANRYGIRMVSDRTFDHWRNRLDTLADRVNAADAAGRVPVSTPQHPTPPEKARARNAAIRAFNGGGSDAWEDSPIMRDMLTPSDQHNARGRALIATFAGEFAGMVARSRVLAADREAVSA